MDSHSLQVSEINSVAYHMNHDTKKLAASPRGGDPKTPLLYEGKGIGDGCTT
jgi:hypothetical protein